MNKVLAVAVGSVLVLMVVIACQRVTVVDGTLNDQEESGVVYRSKPKQTDKGHQRDKLQADVDAVIKKDEKK